MAYTSFEKFTTVAFAVGKAVAAGTTCFAAGTVAGLSSPLMAVVVTVGATGSLLHTARSKLNQIKKNRNKLSRIEEQESDQKLLMEQLAALKPRMQKILEKEREKKAEKQPQKNPVSPVSLTMSPDEQAKTVLQVKKEYAARDRKAARDRREKKLKELETAYQKLNLDLAIQSPNVTVAEIKPVTEKPEEVQTSKLEQLAKVGTGFFNGLGQAGALTFAAISTVSQALNQEVPLLSPGMIVPVVVIGVGVGIGNAIRSNKEYANELQEEELYQKYRARKKELQAEYIAINLLLKQFDEIEGEPPRKKASRATTALPGTLAIPSPNTPVRRASSGEKEGDNDHGVSSPSDKSEEALSPKTMSNPFPAAGQTDIALTIRPTTPASGAPKNSAQQTTRITYSSAVTIDVTPDIRPTTASSVAIDIRPATPATPATPVPVTPKGNKPTTIPAAASLARPASASLGAAPRDISASRVPIVRPTTATSTTTRGNLLPALSAEKSSTTRQPRPAAHGSPAALGKFGAQRRAKTPVTSRKPVNTPIPAK